MGAHVAELLARLEEWGEEGATRCDLRLVALIHDAMKFRVSNRRPKTGENHHAMRARRFAERHTRDERVLATIELHDRPYDLWRRMRRKGRLDRAGSEEMLDRVPDLALFVRFVELDGSTEGKDPEPLAWFRDELARRDGPV